MIKTMQKAGMLIHNPCRQISLLILTKFKPINKLLSTLKSSGNIWFSDDLKANISEFIG